MIVLKREYPILAGAHRGGLVEIYEAEPWGWWFELVYDAEGNLVVDDESDTPETAQVAIRAFTEWRDFLIAKEEQK